MTTPPSQETGPTLPARPTLPPRPTLALRQYLWVFGAILVVGATLHWLSPVLTPFLFGAILAYLGQPIVRYGARFGLSRTVGTLVAVLVVGMAILGVLFVIVPLVQAEVGQILRRLPELGDRLVNDARPWLSSKLGVELRLDAAAFRDLVAQNAESAKALSVQMLASVKTGGLMLISILVNLALIPVVMFYMLRDWNRMLARIDHLVPRRWAPLVRGMAHDIDHVLSEFLHGQVLVMLSLAVYYSIGLWLAGLQFALPIGILTGLLVFIPYVGFGTGLILGTLAALLQWNGLPGFLAVLAVYGVGQLLENYVLLPYLVGDRIGLHPLAVIFALMAFGQLFGFAGVLIALPASAVLLVGLRRLRASYLASPLYRA